jgi:hypothetical protein
MEMIVRYKKASNSSFIVPSLLVQTLCRPMLGRKNQAKMALKRAYKFKTPAICPGFVQLAQRGRC